MSSTLARPKAILFDWDNTLVNTWPTIHAALNHCMREMGEPEWSLAQVKAQVKQSMRDAFPALFGERWEEASHIYQSYYREIHLHNLAALEGAEALLQWLRGCAVYVAVVSNKRGPNLRRECAHLGWEPYFDRIIGADDAERDKPDIAPALMALEDSGIAPSPEVWFVGDTVVDLACAANLGATPVLYGDVASDEARRVYDGHAFAFHARDHTALHGLFTRHLSAAA